LTGRTSADLTQASLRQQVGRRCCKKPFLFSDTVMNNLKYAREGATDEECIAAAKQANAHEFIVNLPQGYDTMMTERGSNLSQGQRQMVTIARAMVADPEDAGAGRGDEQRGHAHGKAHSGGAKRG
jgi:ATP-binding cassette subfamily B protein